MIIDFLKEGSSDCPLIRLRAGSKLDASNLASVIRDVIALDDQIDIFSTVGFFRGENIQSLIFKLDIKDEGIKEHGKGNFECGYSKDHYSDILEMLDAYQKKRSGYFWLDGNSPTDISLLLSYNGDW